MQQTIPVCLMDLPDQLQACAVVHTAVSVCVLMDQLVQAQSCKQCQVIHLVPKNCVHVRQEALLL